MSKKKVLALRAVNEMSFCEQIKIVADKAGARVQAFSWLIIAKVKIIKVLFRA